MPRSHPPTLLTLCHRTLTRELGVGRGDRLLAAVSGGPDSMALLHALATLRARVGFALVAHGVDHGLRAEAAAELDGAERLAARLDVPFARTKVDVPRGGNLQARARAARYEALRAAAIAADAPAIATAHHMDDRAETVLLRLLRGAGPVGLAVLPPRAPLPGANGIDLIRPFVRARRAAIEAHLARHAIPFARDPSNDDAHFLRARVRHELMPLLTDLGPGIVEHLCALADQLGDGASRDASPAPIALAQAAPLGRRVREALRELVESGSPRRRVALPGGLEAYWATRDGDGDGDGEHASAASAADGADGASAANANDGEGGKEAAEASARAPGTPEPSGRGGTSPAGGAPRRDRGAGRLGRLAIAPLPARRR